MSGTEAESGSPLAPPPTRPFLRDAGLVVAAVLLVYGNSLLNGFAYDDVGIIVRNPIVTEPGRLRDIWLSPYWPRIGERVGLYRPLTIAAFALQWQLADGAAWLFHAFSVALHALACVLLLGVLRRLAGAMPALLGALLFAVHPLHTEAVANVVGQAELIAACAVLGACWLWLSRPQRVAAGRTTVVALLYALAALAKEHALVLPALLVALDVAAGRARPNVGAWLRSILPAMALLAAVAASALALRVLALGSFMGTDVGSSLTFLHGGGRVWAALRVWPEYLRLLLLPIDLSSDYSPAVILPPDGPSALVLVGGVLLLGTVALAFALPVLPRTGLVAAWFLILILPVSNLFYPIGVLLAERTLYLPSAALALALAFAAPRRSAAADARTRRLALVAALAVLALFGARSALRNPSWRDSASVARTLYAEHPESYRAQWQAARLTWQQGNAAAAADHFRLAYRLWPHSAALLTEYGEFLTATGDAAAAIPLLERAREMEPLSITTERALGRAYARVGDDARAQQSRARLERLTAP